MDFFFTEEVLCIYTIHDSKTIEKRKTNLDPEKIDLPPIESRDNSSSSRDTSPTQTLQVR